MKYTKTNAKKQRKFKHYVWRGFLYFALILLLLVPTYIAVASFILQKNAPTENTHAVYDSLALEGPTARRIQASETENPTLFSTFLTLSDNGVEVIAVPETHRAGHYVATMQNETVSDRYDFYFLPGTRICYYTTPDNKIFRVDHDLTSSFLNSSYAFELYDGSTLPVLTTAATDEVLPTGVTWYYRTANGQFTERTQNDLSTTAQTYPIANDIAFDFSIKPSSHKVTIHRAGVELYSGTAENITLSLLDNELLDFEIRATYDPDSRLDFYGELIYRFRMQVVEAAHFSLSTQTITAGSAVLLSCENVKNIEKLQISVPPAIDPNFSPVVFRRADYVYAVFPAAHVGTYDVRVTYGTVVGTFQLTVTPATAQVHTPNTAALNGDWVTLLTSTLPNLLDTLSTTTDSALTPYGALSAPNGELIFGYGDTLEIAGTTLAQEPLPFSLYRTSGSVQVLAAGRVVALGNDLQLGKYVVVDHGCGLYTWYAGLSETRVVRGEVLASGDTVGIAGTTLYHEESVLMMATLGKTPLSIDLLQNEA